VGEEELFRVEEPALATRVHMKIYKHEIKKDIFVVSLFFQNSRKILILLFFVLFQRRMFLRKKNEARTKIVTFFN
jgi:hypothetical protein